MRSGPEVVLEQNWARDAPPAGRRRASPWRPPPGRRGCSRRHLRLQLRRGLRRPGTGGRAAGLCAPGDEPAHGLEDDQHHHDRQERRGGRGRAAATAATSLAQACMVQAPSGLEKQATAQLSAFNVVLYFFSGVALFVGGFLILNSFNMTVLQRMREIGMLRTLGATPRMIVGNVLVEALAIGSVGTLLGLGLGLRARPGPGQRDERLGHPDRQHHGGRRRGDRRDRGGAARHGGRRDPSGAPRRTDRADSRRSRRPRNAAATAAAPGADRPDPVPARMHSRWTLLDGRRQQRLDRLGDPRYRHDDGPVRRDRDRSTVRDHAGAEGAGRAASACLAHRRAVGVRLGVRATRCARRRPLLR